MAVSTAVKFKKRIEPACAAPTAQASVYQGELDSFGEEALLQGEEYEVAENIAGFYLILNEWSINDSEEGQV